MKKQTRATAHTQRRIRLGSLAILCAIALIPATVVWMANLYIGLAAVLSSASTWPTIPTDGSGALLHALSGDLSTISTLIPLLLLLFPLVQAIRILKRHAHDEAAIHELGVLPYPAHFPFFLVMLGLTGTLYGLWIGLSVSGVASMGSGIPQAEELPKMLDRLLDGTATALLSSLIGLIGAFFAARPLPLLFEWTACLNPAEEDRTLEETIDHLTRDLKSLSTASRTATEALNPTPLLNALDAISQIQKASEQQTEAIKAQSTQLDAMAHALTTIRDALAPLSAISDSTERAASRAAETPPLLQELVTTQRNASSQLAQALSAIQQERERATQQLARLHGDLNASLDAAQRERSRFRNACAAYLKGVKHDD
jgi:hypothetical protein